MGALEELQRIGCKLFAADGTSVRLRELVPVFHRWIQSQAVRDHLLIDVADYEHVPEGPGVLLAAHQGNFSLDLGRGRMGLAYNRKTTQPGGLAERVRAALCAALTACRLLEDDPALTGRLRFRGDELYVFANDRLHAPNSAATLAGFQPTMDAIATALYAAGGYQVTAERDPRERFGLRVTAATPLSARQLLERLA